MKAAVLHAPRDLRVEEREVPILGPTDVRVRARAGGICGSDLHYFLHGGFGSVRLREPMILGHEMAGEVDEVGAAVTRVRRGDRVVVNPSLPCGTCVHCLAGTSNHCLDMRFYGSAMRMPHVQGVFREVLVCSESQAVVVPGDLPFERAAFAEPLAVCLHAAAEAGSLAGQHVLVCGVGPIGALTILTARHAGAGEVVATDLVAAPVALASRLGADRSLDLGRHPDALDVYGAANGHFDVVFEASGSGAALAAALDVTRPRGVIVQIGLAGEIPVQIATLVTKEIALRGSFRFHAEFAMAAHLIASGAVDVAPLLTETFPLADASRAFELAADRSRSMKVQLAL